MRFEGTRSSFGRGLQGCERECASVVLDEDPTPSRDGCTLTVKVPTSLQEEWEGGREGGSEGGRVERRRRKDASRRPLEQMA